MSPQEERVYAEFFLIRNKFYNTKEKLSHLIFKQGLLLVKTYERYISLIQFLTVELTPIFIQVRVSSTVTLIAGKAVKYIHLCMLMCVEMDFNLVQVKTFVVHWYIYISLIVFVFISCLHCFVHKIDLSLMLTLILLIIKMACFLNIK